MEFTIRLKNNRKIEETENVKDICAFLKEKIDGCEPHLSDLLDAIKLDTIKSGESRTTLIPCPPAPSPVLSGLEKYNTWVTLIRTE